MGIVIEMPLTQREIDHGELALACERLEDAARAYRVDRETLEEAWEALLEAASVLGLREA